MTTPSRKYPWRVVLIVEDETDGVVVQALARKLRPDVLIDPLPVKGCGEIKRRLPALVRTAKSQLSRRGCVAVLLDQDHKDLGRDEPHRSIHLACRQLGVPLLLCSQDMEAWLLTDPGCRDFLKLPALRGTTDSLVGSKKLVSDAYLKVTGRSYDKRLARQKLALQVAGPRPQSNLSLSAALTHLSRCKV